MTGQQRQRPFDDSPSETLLWRDFLDALAASVGEAVEQLATARRLACPPQPRGPVECALLESIRRLAEARTSLELGELSPAAAELVVGAVLEACEEAMPTEDRVLEVPVSWIAAPAPPPVFAMAAPPPSAPLPPEAIAAIERIIALIREMLERGVIQGDAAEAVRRLVAELEELLELARQGNARAEAVLRKLRQLVGTVINLLRRIASLFPKAGNLARRWLAALLRLLRILRPLLGRFLVFLGPIFLLLFAADVGWAAGSELAKIPVGDDETIGTWWGNRLWELLRGPCPELLEALNLATRRWRELERLEATPSEQAEALARVILLESEYARRCLAAGSGERERAERYIRLLQQRYSRLIEGGGGTGGGAATRTCHVTITLVDVVYDGDDIGDDWAFTIVAQGQSTEVDEHELRPNQRESLLRTVFDADAGPCPGIAVVTLTVEAREIDPFGNDVGLASRLLRFACPGSHEERLVVRVREGARTADLTFTFRIEASCR